MNAILFRGATLLALLLFCLPAIAQRTRFESQGEAFIAAEDKAMIETALVRHVFGAPQSGKGQIVFFRSQKSTSAAFEVRENGAELATLPSGSYFIVAAQPGTYSFTVDAEAGEVLTVEVKPGRTHFVKASNRRAEGERPYLSRADAMTFLGAIGGRRLSIL
ncbi:hypothetical protein [Lysobacter sp. CFH 32150]|uniref:hypothetical protein n=1 Tax=Lysobacter sp. CFH 32150 TaxID=2927128 RepID=UPI001FA71FAB|nr:hypothetical protein [Lysobacter sp. CFH 32150]MCI4568265.1 hypothetical protein [Lysobacter sp. CFH 32150]